jgi:hypothetical protein
MRRIFLYALPAALALAACSGGQAPAPTPTPSPVLRNPLNVALYPQAEVISVRSFRQVVTGEQTRGTVFADGAGTYDGQEVVAASDAPFSKLAAWVHHFGSSGPGDTHQYGFDYAAFERGAGKGRHGTLVVVLDPQIVDRQFGSVLDIIAKYRSMPAFMRAPIDQEVKRRIGITLSDAMQPASPIGATLAALGDFEQRNSRGIVIVDAVRR